MADIESKVQEFISVTGVDEERARFYLQSANGELHIALGTFYDNDAADSVLPNVNDGGESNPLDGSSAPFQNVNMDSSSNNSSELSQDTQRGFDSSKRSKKPARFATISNFQNDSDSDNEEGQAFYAGGSEASGQQILGPDKKKKGNEVSSIFDAARTHGAEVVSAEQENSSKQNAKSKNIFKGTGFKLGSEVEPSEQVASATVPSNILESRAIAIKFWKNGFSVDDGPLRDLHDPHNKDFLTAIRQGKVPAELRGLVANGEVHVNLEDHSEEEFVKPKVAVQAFSGQGRVLGSPAPNVVSSSSPAPLTSNTPPCSQPQFEVDQNKPITTIQIRFADGTRLVAKFNHDNTIGDIRRLVANAKPNSNSNFKLMTTFPNKVLSEDSQTIQEAKLLNAVIVQRMT